MLLYVAGKLGQALLTLFLASVVIFLILRLIPGDPATVLAGADATDETIASIRQNLGLDQSIPTQYLHWIGAILTFDLGRSYVIGGDIGALIAHALGNTVVLAITALVFALLISAVLSFSVVLRPTGWLIAVVNAFATVSIAVPTFVTGVILVAIFALWLPLLPGGGSPPDGYFANPWITFQYLILPGLCIALPVASTLTRFLTEALRTELAQPYVLTARAAGISARRILFHSVLRNALPSTVTVLGIQIGQLLGAAILVETIFAWPGLGQLLAQSIAARDYPLVQALLLLSVTIFIVTATLTDVVQAALDPVARREEDR
ncbi:MAG: ABC transporter permease [Gordonia sp. (in: high G+C Gram-positive bacteria)]